MNRPESYLDWNATAPLRPEAAAALWRRLPAAATLVGASLGPSRPAERRAGAGGGGGADRRGTQGSSLSAAHRSQSSGAARHRARSACWFPRSSTIRCCRRCRVVPIAVDGVSIIDLAGLDHRLAAEPRPAIVSVMLANTRPDHSAGRRVPRSPGRTAPCSIATPFRPPARSARHRPDRRRPDQPSAHKLGGSLASARWSSLATPSRPLSAAAARSVAAGPAARTCRASPVSSGGRGGSGHRRHRRVRRLRDGFEAAVFAAAPEAIVIGAATPRLPNTSAIALPGVSAETQVIALDLDGVMVSAGAACSSGKVGPSHVLQAMGAAPEIAGSTIRVSLGWSTTDAEIEHFLKAWTAMYRRVKPHAAAARAA